MGVGLVYTFFLLCLSWDLFKLGGGGVYNRLGGGGVDTELEKQKFWGL